MREELSEESRTYVERKGVRHVRDPKEPCLKISNLWMCIQILHVASHLERTSAVLTSKAETSSSYDIQSYVLRVFNIQQLICNYKTSCILIWLKIQYVKILQDFKALSVCLCKKRNLNIISSSLLIFKKNKINPTLFNYLCLLTEVVRNNEQSSTHMSWPWRKGPHMDNCALLFTPAPHASPIPLLPPHHLK